MEPTDIVGPPYPLLLAVDVSGQTVATVRVAGSYYEHIVWDRLQRSSNKATHDIESIVGRIFSGSAILLVQPVGKEYFWPNSGMK